MHKKRHNTFVVFYIWYVFFAICHRMANKLHFLHTKIFKSLLLLQFRADFNFSFLRILLRLPIYMGSVIGKEIVKNRKFCKTCSKAYSSYSVQPISSKLESLCLLGCPLYGVCFIPNWPKNR